MIGEKKRLQIANICYANVAGRFAMFCNPEYRGENFTWEWFVKNCEEDADMWLALANVHGKSSEVISVAQEYAKEIAQTLVKRVTE